MLELLADTAKLAQTRKSDSLNKVPHLWPLFIHISGSFSLSCHHLWIKSEFQAGNKIDKFILLGYEKTLKEVESLGLSTAKHTDSESILHDIINESIPLMEKRYRL